MAGYMPRKRWEAFIWYSSFFIENFRFSTVLRRLDKITSFPAFCRKPQVSSAEFTSPILLATVCSHTSAVPNSSKLFSKTSSAKGVHPHERSTSSYGLRRKIPPFLLVTDACHVSVAPWKTAPNSSGAFLSPMNKPTCTRPLAIPSGAKTYVKSRRRRVMKKNLSISRSLGSITSSVFFLSSKPKAFAMSRLSSTNGMLSCRQRAASARCEPQPPSLRRARWKPW